MVDEEQPKKRRSYIFYSILLAAALITAASTITQAANFVNTDGYINLSSSCTNLTNGTCTINYNTTRYAGPTRDGILSSADWILFNTTNNGSFNYANYFDQTLNKSSEVEFNNIKAHTSAGITINASNTLPVADFGAGNTNNTLFYGSVTLFNGQNICLGGVCRSTWPNSTGNISGASNSSNSLAVWNSTGTITNSSVLVDTPGNAYFSRNILLKDYGSDSSILFNNGAAGGITWVQSSDRIRYACNNAGTGLCELYGSGIYFAGTNNAVLDFYSDSVDRNIGITNDGSKGANLNVDNNITANDKIKADLFEFNVTHGNASALFNNRTDAVSNSTVVLMVENSSMPFMTVEYGTRARKQYTLMPSFGPFTNMILWQPGGISGTTVPTVLGTAAAATTNTGTITNTISNFTGPLWGSTTTTTYRSHAHVTWTPLMLYTSAGVYCEGTIIPGGSASYNNHDMFAGITSGTNGTTPLWTGLYTDTASIGILLAQNATTGLGPAFHIYAANTAARTVVNTTINVTPGNIYKYSFYKPADENMTYYTFTNQNASRTFTGNISTSLPNEGTAMRPGISILQRGATAAILRSTGQMCMSWPTLR